jgi:CMP-N-acetylneuraminic acid synthetase
VKKNIRPIAGYRFGLIEIKLRQLLESEAIDEIVLSTDDAEIVGYGDSLNEPRLRIHQRIESLSSNTTSTDQLVAHVLDLVSEGHVLWTHVTSPFITAKHYDEIIRIYLEMRGSGYDSLMTTTEIHGFLWMDGKPINYDRNNEKWPRTQTLDAVHEINSGAFVAPTDVYRELNDRIGRCPYLYAMDKLEGFDIDWPEDFMMAECLLKNALVKI